MGWDEFSRFVLSNAEASDKTQPEPYRSVSCLEGLSRVLECAVAPIAHLEESMRVSIFITLLTASFCVLMQPPRLVQAQQTLSASDEGSPPEAENEEAAPARRSADLSLSVRNIDTEESERPLDGVLEGSLMDAFDALLVPGGLAVEEAVELARNRAPAALKAEAGVEIAEARAKELRASFWGRAEVGYRYTRISRIDMPNLFEMGDDGPPAADPEQLRPLVNSVQDPSAQILFGTYVDMLSSMSNLTFPILRNQHAFTASYTYPVTDVFTRVLPGYRASKLAREASEYEKSSILAGVERDTRIAYYEYARALSSQIIAQESRRQMEAAREQVAVLVRTGMLPQVDLMRMDAQVASTSVLEAQAEAGVRASEEYLKALLGLSRDEVVALAPSLLDPVGEVTLSEEEAYETALRERRELLALRVATQAQREAARAEAGGRYPQIFAVANAEISNPNQRIIPQTQEFRESWDVSAVLRWSPDETVVASRRMRVALAELQRIEADEVALTDALRAEIAQAYHSYEAARRGLEAATIGVEAAEESYRIRAMQLEAGAAVTRDLIDAEADLTRARLEFVAATIGIRQAKVALEHAMGVYAR